VVSEDMVRDVVDYLYKVFIDSILSKLRNIVDESKRYLYFLAWLNNELEKKRLGRIIITGGICCRDIYSKNLQNYGCRYHRRERHS
jgi:hypothetical protein